MLNFIADYTDRAGHDLHMSFQAFADGPAAKMLAAIQIFRGLEAEGFTPQAIIYVPGNYTMPELDRMSEVGPIPPGARPVYVSGKTIAEARSGAFE